jgi:hypothetical protein
MDYKLIIVIIVLIVFIGIKMGLCLWDDYKYKNKKP